MKKIGKKMEEMGFKQNSAPSVKAAFIKHLIRSAYNVDVDVPKIYSEKEDATLDVLLNTSLGEQLCLDIEEKNKAG